MPKIYSTQKRKNRSKNAWAVFAKVHDKQSLPGVEPPEDYDNSVEILKSDEEMDAFMDRMDGETDRIVAKIERYELAQRREERARKEHRRIMMRTAAACMVVIALVGTMAFVPSVKAFVEVAITGGMNKDRGSSLHIEMPEISLKSYEEYNEGSMRYYTFTDEGQREIYVIQARKGAEDKLFTDADDFDHFSLIIPSINTDMTCSVDYNGFLGMFDYRDWEYQVYMTDMEKLEYERIVQSIYILDDAPTPTKIKEVSSQ